MISPRDRRSPRVRASAQPSRSSVAGIGSSHRQIEWLEERGEVVRRRVGDDDELPAHCRRVRGEAGKAAGEIVGVVVGDDLDRDRHAGGLVEEGRQGIGVGGLEDRPRGRSRWPVLHLPAQGRELVAERIGACPVAGIACRAALGDEAADVVAAGRRRS